MIAALLAAVCFLAYANGANDSFKGVASLYGSGTAGYRTAIAWATVTTLAGSVAAVFLAQSLLRRFSGKGLVPDALVGSERFLLAVAAGAGATVVLATRFGFPISTTHALMGALAGCGWVAVGREVSVGVLGRLFLLPLLLSPLLAVALGAAFYGVFRPPPQRQGLTEAGCLGGEGADRSSTSPGSTAVPAPEIGASPALNAAHFLSAGLVSFARGLNDTPKIAALLVVVPILGPRMGLVAVAVAMAVGGLLSARRVAETMGHRITRLDHGQGFTANLATGLLVTGATFCGLPVSTTHVSVGALFGIGMLTQQADVRVVRHILLSWVVTLPCAAATGALVYWLTGA